MYIMFWGILVLSILSLLYFFVITVYSGLGTAFSMFWLTAGAAGLLVCLGIKYMAVHEIKVIESIRILFIIAAIAGLILFAVIEGIIISHADRKVEQGLDYIIVLGAQIRGTTITKSLKKRLDTALKYLKENPLTVAIVSGGRGEKEALSEAEAMKRYLISRGITENRIIKEDRSRNTFENILYSKVYLKGNSSAAIITNSFHIYRSVQIAKKQGLSGIKGLAAPTDRIMAVNYYVREAAGVLKDKLMGNL